MESFLNWINLSIELKKKQASEFAYYVCLLNFDALLNIQSLQILKDNNILFFLNWIYKYLMDL